MIEVVADDAPVIPDQDIWVAVVVVDSAGNAHRHAHHGLGQLDR